jgi:hypothetical protein
MQSYRCMPAAPRCRISRTVTNPGLTGTSATSILCPCCFPPPPEPCVVAVWRVGRESFRILSTHPNERVGLLFKPANFELALGRVFEILSEFNDAEFNYKEKP